MIVEERSYVLHPGNVPEYLKLYAEEGIHIASPVLGRLIGYFQTEIGMLNGVVHMWAFDSFEDRLERRAKLYASPDWQRFSAKILPLIRTMENRILVPTSFSPLK